MIERGRKNPVGNEQIEQSAEDIIHTIISEALDEVIAELKEEMGKPTKMEKIADIFKQKLTNGGIVIIDDLIHLFEGTYDPKQAASNLMVKFNNRAAKHGLHANPVVGYKIGFKNSSK